MPARRLIQYVLVYFDTPLTRNYLRFRRTYQTIVRATATITTRATTTFEAWPTTSATLVQLLPRNQPAPIKSAFQRAEPAVVSRVNRPGGMWSIPAGTETTLRAPGTIRAKKTTAPPYLSNHPSAWSRSSSLMRRIRP